MARKLKIDMTGIESFSKASEGRHVVKITDIEQKVSSAGDDMLQFTFEVARGDDKGCRVYDNFALTDKALWKFKACLQALGMKADGKIVIDLDKIIGKMCEVEVFHEEYNGQMRAKISDYYKLSSKTEDSDEDEDEDDEDDEPFNSDDDEEEEEVKPTKKTSKSVPKKTKKEPEPEKDEDEESDDKDEDEEEEPAPRKTSKKPAPAKTKKQPAKSKQPEPEDDEDDDEDWEEE